MTNPIVTIRIAGGIMAQGELVAPMIDGKPQFDKNGNVQIWHGRNVLSGEWIEGVKK